MYSYCDDRTGCFDLCFFLNFFKKKLVDGLIHSTTVV
jgi:hypothetical protein